MAERNEKKKEKKKYAAPEMGYCPLSIRQPGAGLGAKLGAVGARPGLGKRAAWARRLARVVHLVPMACFWPGLTQYCSLVDFWTLFVNPFHEHCSSQIFFLKKY